MRWSPSNATTRRLKGVLPKDYARPALDKHASANSSTSSAPLAWATRETAPRTSWAGSTSISSSQFASAEGKKGGQFYTPRCVVRVLVEMLAPYKGRVYDPCCGSGGMFVQSEKFVEAHGGRIGDISIYGQESTPRPGGWP